MAFWRPVCDCRNKTISSAYPGQKRVELPYDLELLLRMKDLSSLVNILQFILNLLNVATVLDE